MVIYSIDTETEGLDATRFILGVLYREDGTHWTEHTPEELWNRVIQEKEKNDKEGLRTYIYAHNHEYDFNAYARGQIIKNKDIHIINTETFIITIGDNCWLLDTYPFYKMNLEKAGEIIGEKKSGHPKCFGRRPTNKEEEKELEEYCIQDCKVTIQLMLQNRAELQKLGFKPRKMLTPGQTAMTCYQTWHKKAEEPWRHIYEIKEGRKQIIKSKYEAKIRQSYRGGIVRAYKKGEFHDVMYIDKRSLYPYIMSTMRFPDLRTEEYIEQPIEKGWTIKDILSQIGVSRVTIKAPKNCIGVLPIRTGTENVYPENGEIIKGNYTNEELYYAINNGYKIKDIHWTLIYQEGPNPFTNYITTLFRQRKNATSEGTKHTIKLLMNSLSGKFAQVTKKKDIRIIPRMQGQEYFSKGYMPKGHSDIYYLVEKEMGTYSPSYANPLISSLITAGGRVYIHSILKMIPKEQLLYCDTDGLFIQGMIKNDIFKIGDGLDDWHVVGEHHPIIIKGKKNYMYDDKIRLSGVKSTEITSKQYKESTEIVVTRITGLLEAARTGNIELAGAPVKKNISINEEVELEKKDYYEEPETQDI